MRNINNLYLSYPDFREFDIIDPNEANQNNEELTIKINEIIDYFNPVISDEGAKFINLPPIEGIEGDNVYDTLVRTAEFLDSNYKRLETHRESSDHDARYYTKTEIDVKTSTLNSNINSNLTLLNTHKTSSDHDSRYYTKTELTPWLRGGDTIIREDVYFIVNPNNGDGTFTYSVNGQNIIGTLGESGEQLFTLVSGYYEPGANRIEATINDTLRRSAKSGGLIEIDNTTVGLTQPEGAGAEITLKYYERIGMTAEYNIKLSVEKPPNNDGKNMWFKVIG